MTMPPKEFALGLESGQFVPCFQPVVLLRSGELEGFEVLARWRHPTLGTIPPDTFVPMAEAEGWIAELTASLMRQAFQAAAALPSSVRLSLNVSPAQLGDDSLPEQIERAANQTGFPLEQVSIEIAETAMRENVPQAQSIAARLRSLGCWIELDDFGAGDASLRQIESFPLNSLKLERSLVQSMMERRESRRMVEAALGLGQSLRIRTVAKGVQTREQAEMLFLMGCDMGQGWLFGEPAPLDELGELASRKIFAPSMAGRSWMTSLLPGNMSPGQRLAQLQGIYDGAPVGLGWIDRQLRFVRVNRRFAQMQGIAVEALQGRTVAEAVPEFYAPIEPYVDRAMAGETMWGVEIAGPRSGDDGRAMVASFQPAMDEGGDVAGVSFALMEVATRNSA